MALKPCRVILKSERDVSLWSGEGARLEFQEQSDTKTCFLRYFIKASQSEIVSTKLPQSLKLLQALVRKVAHPYLLWDLHCAICRRTRAGRSWLKRNRLPTFEDPAWTPLMTDLRWAGGGCFLCF
jgi:hypothetical protein